MALVQMRTPGGSYSMVDEKLVRVYEAEGWVLTSELPEFKTKNVTYYDEARKTVTTTKGEEKPVEKVIDTPQIKTLEDRASQTRKYTDEEFNNLKNTPKEEKLQQIRINRNNGIYLTSSQILSISKTYNISESDIRKAESDGKAGKIEQIESGPLQPGEAGFGIDTWYEFLGYDTEDSAMIDFANGKLTAAQIIRAENEIQPEPADLTVSKNTENKINTEVKNYINSTQVTLYKGNQTKKVDYRNAQKFIDDGWTTQSSDEIKAQEIINSYLVTIYKNGESKKVDFRKVQSFVDDGWSTTAPDEPIVVTETEEETDEYGFTPSQYESGIPIYRKDAPAGGERVFSNADLKTALGNGYSLTTVDITEGPDAGTSAADAGADKVTSQSGQRVGESMSTKYNQFNNIPEGALLVQTDADKLYLMYEVPGQNTLFQGKPIWIFYEVKDNDLYEAGILTKDAPYEINMMLTEEQIDGFVYGGNTADLPGNDPTTGRAPHPFTSFVENVSTQAQIAPWILDIDSVKLLAEAALEGREVTEAEWRMTNWYQTHSEAEREWQRLYYADPTTAQNTVNDYKIQVSRALQAAGVTGGFDPETGMERAVPDALAGWIASKWVSGQWTESYTTEQLALFADPFRSGVRDVELGNYIATAGVDGLERTAEQEDRVRQLYTQWLGPVFGKLTDQEVAQKAGRIRNDPDFEQALIEQLKNNRLALFPQYTNPELTYNDIATPWRNLTTSVWGKSADETQSWWQDMVATNNFTEGAATLRSKGLEQNVDQVTIEATEALQKALGQGSQVADLGVNR